MTRRVFTAPPAATGLSHAEIVSNVSSSLLSPLPFSEIR